MQMTRRNLLMNVGAGLTTAALKCSNFFRFLPVDPTDSEWPHSSLDNDAAIGTRVYPNPITFKKAELHRQITILRSSYSPTLPLRDFLSQSSVRLWTHQELLKGILDGRIDRRIMDPGWLKTQLELGMALPSSFKQTLEAVFSHEMNHMLSLPPMRMTRRYPEAGILELSPSIEYFEDSSYKSFPHVESIEVEDTCARVTCKHVTCEDTLTILEVSLLTCRQRIRLRTRQLDCD
jgi:hypothetical protein